MNPIGYGIGNAGRLESVHAVVVYDEKSGNVVHVHHQLIFAGATMVPTPEKLAEMALHHAESAGVKRHTVKALYAGDRLLDPAHVYRVDPASRKLIAEPRPVKPQSK